MTEAGLIFSDLSSVREPGSILFFGGSFDPPHAGHASLPLAVARSLAPATAIGVIMYVPAARSPHKDDAPTDPAHRLAMLEIAIRQMKHARIWTGELDRAAQEPDSPSYWSATWSAVRLSRPEYQDRFLIGADQALSMHRWHRYQSFWRDAVVMLRDDQDDADELIEAMSRLGVWSDEELKHWRSNIVPVPLVDASSSHVRRCLTNPMRRENPITGLDDRVQDYILQHGLYPAE
jgi:nicotinate-nucleotide adenylyltransferase